jgi:uncharacterized protein (TIRG00374 family)
MNSGYSRIIKFTLLLLITVLLLFISFRGVNFKNILQDVWHANMLWVAFSAIFAIIAFILRAWRWNLLIEPLGFAPPLKKTIYAILIGYLTNLAFPRLGEISRCGVLSKSSSAPFNKLLGTVITERVIDVLSLFACLLLAFIIESKRLGNFLTENILHPLWNKPVHFFRTSEGIIMGLLLLTVVLIVTFYLLRKKRKENVSAVARFFIGLADGIRSIASLKNPWLFILHTILIWLLYYAGVYVCFFALSSTGHLGFSAALFLLVAGGLGMSAPVQGGFGAYHLLVSQGLMLYGLSREDGLTFATLLHSLQTILVVILGVVSLLLIFRNQKK